MTIVLALQEWEQRTPVDTRVLSGQSFDAAPAARKLAEELAQRNMLQVTELRSGIMVEATSYVGRVTLGDLHITVQPKMDIDILRILFRYAYGLRKLTTFTKTSHSLQSSAFQDLLIEQLATEAAELQARGFQRSYVQQAERLASPRGRIDMQQMAQQGGAADAVLPCHHYPRLEDIPANRILLAGLRLAVRITDDLLLRTRLRRLAAGLADQITEIAITSESLHAARRRLNRLSVAYEPAFDLIALLLAGAGITLKSTAQRLALPGFLFDMNLFFEALITRFLSTQLCGCQVHSQVHLRDMMRYLPEANPLRRRPPTPRPDLMIRQGGRTLAILDTKYRDLWEQPLPRDMLYQLAIYALSREHERNATILYPSTGGPRRDQIIAIREPAYGNQQASVLIRAVDLTRLAQAIETPGVAGERRRQTLADALVFGADAGQSQS
jgi:5-methylcytosine-specific restriction enzyme subunit McrC